MTLKKKVLSTLLLVQLSQDKILFYWYQEGKFNWQFLEFTEGLFSIKIGHELFLMYWLPCAITSVCTVIVFPTDGLSLFDCYMTGFRKWFLSFFILRTNTLNQGLIVHTEITWRLLPCRVLSRLVTPPSNPPLMKMPLLKWYSRMILNTFRSPVSDSKRHHLHSVKGSKHASHFSPLISGLHNFRTT